MSMAIDQSKDLSRSICSTRRGKSSSSSFTRRPIRFQFDFSRKRDLPPDQMTVDDTIDRLMQVKPSSAEVNSGFLIIEDEPAGRNDDGDIRVSRGRSI
jgi:hypothetical protein